MAEDEGAASGELAADGGGVDPAVFERAVDVEGYGPGGTVPGHGQAVRVAVDEGAHQDGRVVARRAVDDDTQGAVVAALDQQLVGVAVDRVGQERHDRRGHARQLEQHLDGEAAA